MYTAVPKIVAGNDIPFHGGWPGKFFFKYSGLMNLVTDQYRR